MSDWRRYIDVAMRRTKKSPATWKPENEGDEIRGLLVSIKKVESQYGLSTVAEIKTDDGMRSVWLSKFLLNAFDRQVIGVGTVVSIVFLGKKRNRANTATYNDYSGGKVLRNGIVARPG